MTETKRAGIHPDLYDYARRSAWRASRGITGCDAEDMTHDVVCTLWERDIDLTEDTRDARSAIMWEARTQRTLAIREARRRGDEPSETAAAGGLASGALDTVVHALDVYAAAWDRLEAEDVAAYRLAVWATYSPTLGSRLPATGSVLPFADRQDRITRGARVRDAIRAYERHVREITDALAAVNIGVTSRDAETFPGAVAHPLVDVAFLARTYGWDDETRDGALAVTGALSSADKSALYLSNVAGPVGTTVAPRGERVGMGGRGRSGALSGIPLAGTVAGSTIAGGGRQRLASEQPARSGGDDAYAARVEAREPIWD